MSEGKSKSPHELLYGAVAPTRDILVFGCEAWVMLLKAKLTALGSKVHAKGVFVGYPMPVGSRQYLVLIAGVVVRSSVVQFLTSQIASVAPVSACQSVPVAVPTPELSASECASDDGADSEIYRGEPANVRIEWPDVQRDVQPDVQAGVQSIQIVHTDCACNIHTRRAYQACACGHRPRPK